MEYAVTNRVVFNVPDSRLHGGGGDCGGGLFRAHGFP